jgi:hypothetical protein
MPDYPLIVVSIRGSAEPGWLPDDELTRDWLEHVRQYRSECDAADCRRLLEEGERGLGVQEPQ